MYNARSMSSFASYLCSILSKFVILVGLFRWLQARIKLTSECAADVALFSG